MADTWLDLITDALSEIGAYAPGDSISPADQDLATRRVNRIIDTWSARRVFAFNVNFALYTLIANHSPHTIGPSGDFAVPARPVRIENAALVLSDTAFPVDVPIRLRDDDWWANQRVKTITTSVPTDLYYSPDFPNGALNLWPIPNYAYGLRLETWVQLAGVPLDGNGLADLLQPFTPPPGYSKALSLTLSEELCRPMGRPLMPDLVQNAARARADLQKNNIQSPRISTADYGLRRGDFNYYTGQ